MNLYFLYIFLMGLATFNSIIYDFNKDSDLDDWFVVNDGVMGGLSNGNLELSSNGHAVFSGFVSTENNGGFTSIRLPFEKKEVTSSSLIKLKLKGDAKRYQIRIKGQRNDWWSYITYIDTVKEWNTYMIPMNQFEPSFRGRKLEYPNFDKSSISEFGILIGNKQNEDFQLIIDLIEIVH